MAGDFFPEYSLSSSGRLAYTVDANGDLDIYVLDTHASDVPPINLSNLSESADRPLAWSPDGQMLALESVDATGNASLVIWNGKSNITIPLTKEAITFQRIDADWSPNGRYLMIRAQVDADTELAYIWDGATIQPLLPFGIDDSVRLQNYRREWSPDSTQLSFIVSFPDGSNRLYVWDGSETIDIMPPLFARDSNLCLPAIVRFTTIWPGVRMGAWLLPSLNRLKPHKSIVGKSTSGMGIPASISVSKSTCMIRTLYGVWMERSPFFLRNGFRGRIILT